MDSPQNIKKRLKSVSNINQITKAMELVSATKMRKSQQIALDSRPYALAALDLLANISRLENLSAGGLPVFLQKRNLSAGRKKIIFVLIASDKGLAGSFNSSVFKKFEKFKKPENFACLAIGEKARSYLEKRGFEILKSFSRVGDFTTPEESEPVAKFLADGYLNKDFDEAIVFSTHFKSALKQDPVMRKILPVDFKSIKKSAEEIIPETGRFADLIKEQKIDFSLSGEKPQEYIIEPSPEKVLEKLIRHLFYMQIYHLILEANASEHSARRMAMKNASDNANDLAQKLALQYNKSRQSAITKELIEITSGTWEK